MKSLSGENKIDNNQIINLCFLNEDQLISNSFNNWHNKFNTEHDDTHIERAYDKLS